ncbi:MAG: pyridoxal 5'-phosphate synthase glutaminase subunit PdxT [Anaerolineae bacterium]
MTVSPQNLTLDPNPAQPPSTALKIGVLALQGAFLEHTNMLRKLGATPVEVRLPQDLDGLDGLIIPGGESTTIGKLANQFGLMPPLHDFVAQGRAVWGTCAGLIFLAKDIGSTGSGGHVVPPRLAVMDVTVDRNAFGRQVDSFEADLWLPFAPTEAPPFRAVFIRAPKIEAVGEGVEVLATLDNGAIVAARQGNLLVTAFHPELTNDNRFHQLFLQMILTAQ